MRESPVTPSVSIIVPVRNRAAMLRDLLESLIAQAYPPERLEVIVVDGDSSDPIAAIVAEFDARAGFPLRCLRVEDDRGPVSKRNLGARTAASEIFAFTDSDCRATPGWIAALVAPFAAPTIGFVSGPVTYKSEQPRTFFSKLTAETLVEHPTYPTANIAYRRGTFLAANGFDETLAVKDFLGRATECGDTDLAWRIRKAGWSNAFAADALILHEVEQLSPVQWLVEPTRLILLPLLLRLHPELAPQLLRWNLVFYPGTLAVYAVLAIGLLLLVFEPRLLPLAFVAGLVAIWTWKIRSASPRRIVAVFRDAAFHFARMGVMAATLVVGSLRYGRIVV